MEVHFPPEVEAKLTYSAARQGRKPDQLVQDVVSRYFEEERENFFAAKTIDQLIAEQSIKPIASIGIFAGTIPDEDVDEFVADIYRNRT